MKKRLLNKGTIIGLMIMIMSFYSNAQHKVCDCTEVFSEMAEKVEANYIGLKHLQAKEKGDEYEQRKSEFITKAKSVEALNCTAFLQEFVDYFEDGHLSILDRPLFDDEQKDSILSKIQGERLDIKSINHLLTLSGNQDPYIGKYTDGVSDFAIVRENDIYKAYVLMSKDDNTLPGELKASFKKVDEGIRGSYYTYDQIPWFLKGGLYKEGTLLRVGSEAWIKTDSEFKRELEMVNFEGETHWPTIQKIDDDNVLFSIPDFDVDIKVWNALVKENQATLLNAKNLIFDIRGNRGGNAIYFSVFNLFSDREMPGGQGHVLASEDILAYFERNMQYSKKIYGPVVEAIKENMGAIVDGPLYPKRNYKRKNKSKVENVAILTDEACMSAAESFILHSMQASSLVKTFGSPTNGVIDYTSVGSVFLKSSGSQRIILAFPTSTLHKDIPENGYNKTGMIPDVPIDNKVNDKVAFIVEYYKKAK